MISTGQNFAGRGRGDTTIGSDKSSLYRYIYETEISTVNLGGRFLREEAFSQACRGLWKLWFKLTNWIHLFLPQFPYYASGKNILSLHVKLQRAIISTLEFGPGSQGRRRMSSSI